MIKSKLTLQYVLSLGILSIIIVAVNLVAVFSILYSGNSMDGKAKAIDGFTRDFQKYIEYKNEKIEISKVGEDILSKKKLWIQVLNEDGNEVESYNKPDEVKVKHTPSDIVNGYKYGGSIDEHSEILFGNKEIKGKTYTYMIGFPMNQVRKYTLVVDNESFIENLKKILIIILLIDIILAAILGYIFSVNLTKPIKKIVTGIGNLSGEGEYGKFEEKGLYKSVFHQMNELSVKLKMSEKEREELNRMRKEWIANISHDIKTPLASINGYAELMDGSYELTDGEVKKYAGIIQKKSEYIKGLVEDLNLTMKLEADENVIIKNKVNIVSLVRDTIIEILNDPKYQNIDVELICEKEFIERELDEKLVKRAISNIVYNALIHNGAEVKIKIDIKEENRKAKVIIWDNGKGIKKEDLNKIFERYYRGTNTGEAHKGSGLGMAIVKDIVNSHGGEINIYSKEGSGVKVEITI